MSIYFGAHKIAKVIYNGADITKAIANGYTRFTSGPPDTTRCTWELYDKGCNFFNPSSYNFSAGTWVKWEYPDGDTYITNDIKGEMNYIVLESNNPDLRTLVSNGDSDDVYSVLRHEDFYYVGTYASDIYLQVLGGGRYNLYQNILVNGDSA